MASFRKEDIASAGNNARRVWKTVDIILGVAESGAKSSHDFIDKKICDVRAATASADYPSFVDRQAPKLFDFELVSVDDVTKAIGSASSKQCAPDPLPTWLLKQLISTLALFITTTLFNTSLADGYFSRQWRNDHNERWIG